MEVLGPCLLLLSLVRCSKFFSLRISRSNNCVLDWIIGLYIDYSIFFQL
jgi:hypothetical protein